MNSPLDIIKDQTLTYHQQVFNLAKLSEDSIMPLNTDSATEKLIQKGIICTMFEGNAPYRPRYVIPDYAILMKKGCDFLDLKAPQNIWEATNALLILYKHVPSIDYFPVYLGNLDSLLNPFISEEKEEEARLAIRLFLQHIDRTLTGSFVHANIGPEETLAGRIILEASEELNCAIPNITLKYQEGITPDSFLNSCAETALKTAKPSFANNRIYSRDFKEFGETGYAIASCYNGLAIGGGGFTLQRLVLSRLAEECCSPAEFLEKKLPEASRLLLNQLDERIRFLTEESAFFKSNFLVKEGFIHQDRFTGMFGIVGLADAVNYLMHSERKKDRFGSSEAADQLGVEIIETLNKLVHSHISPYIGCFGGRHVLHAQVGIDNDKDITPGCRIPIGEEPEIMEHILQSARYHNHFLSGIGDIFVFEKTYLDNPEALSDIVKGAMKSDLRYFSAYSADSDVIRVTGYLVKRSEMEKLEQGQAVLNQSTVLGLGMKREGCIFNRALRK
ncbi:MAG: YjjI family glycine radical enzyme [Spirochaetaceae bacterium 4572_59]|nr:MAG: YjjI family glycine radical enzyme [Spirochaetaceae bacterium 4572_59]